MVVIRKGIKKPKPKKLTALDVEMAVSDYFDVRRNLVVPNVFWGMFDHECDLFILSKAGYGYEVEIKISKADLIKDKEKKHGHKSDKIKYLYFAIPDYLEDCIEHIPERAGIISIYQHWYGSRYYTKCRVLRQPIQNCKYNFTQQERFQIARLGALRIWGLKQKIINLKKQINRKDLYEPKVL